MREVVSWIEGSLTLSESTVVQHGGTIEHDLTVSANTHLDLHGAVGGDLIVEPGGIAKVHGTVLGTLYNDGGEVEVCPGAAPRGCGGRGARRFQHEDPDCAGSVGRRMTGMPLPIMRLPRRNDRDPRRS